MKDIVISDAVKYIGADDKDLDLFESQYIVPNGVSYNSYVILDEKIAVMDKMCIRDRDRMVPGGWTGLPDPCISDERYRNDRDRYLRRIFT